jgi:hypothetical protein
MKENILRSLIKEELAKALNEIAAKFQEGDTFLYMGQKHIVMSDNGYTIKAKLPDGKIKNYNYNQIKNALNESDTPKSVSEIEPGTYTFSYKERDEFGDITKGTGRKITIDADKIKKYGDISLTNYFGVLSIWDWKKID